MRLSLWFTLVIVAFLAVQSAVDAGIIRRSRRLRRIGMQQQGPRSPRVMQRRKWPHFLAPPRGSHGRSMPRSKHSHPEMREERFSHHRPMPHQLKRLPMMSHGQQQMVSASTQLNNWRPLDFGNPIDRDPTFDYAPPSLERVRFSEGRPEGRPEARKRKPVPKMANREAGKHRPQIFKPPRSSRPTIWKLLATKQRRRPHQKRRPINPYMRFPENPGHSNKDEAEVFPRFPNMVYFQSKDVLGNHQHGNRPHGNGAIPHPNGGLYLMNQRLPGQKPSQGFTNKPNQGFPNKPNQGFTNKPNQGFTNNPNQGFPNNPNQGHTVKPTPGATINPTQGQSVNTHSGQSLNSLSGHTLNPLPGLTIKLAPGLTSFPILKPGKVTNVPLYSHESQSPSQFNPITSTTPMTVKIPKQPDDILYRPQDYMNPTRKPTILQPIYSTPVTLTATRNSVIKPIDPTESLVNIINDPPKPISGVSVLSQVNSLFEHFQPPDIIREEQSLDDDTGETEEARVEPVPNVYDQPPAETPVEIPVKDNKGEESSTVSISTSVSTSTSVLIRGTEVSTSSTSTTTESSTSSSTSSPFPKLPEMPTYKKRQPIYPKRYSAIKSSAEKPAPTVSNSKDTNGSGEGLVITVARSKVKEYKPQFLANFTQLLTFDKVADADDNESSESTIYITTAIPSLKVTSAPVFLSTTPKPSETTPKKKSPMQDFDPMQLLHSWFQNT